MTYLSAVTDASTEQSLASTPASLDPRAVMARRLPSWLQPFLTWLTAKPADAAKIEERSPLRFVAAALAYCALGIALSVLALHVPLAPATALLLTGCTLTTCGLGLFQVVVFHHCSHGTVFRNRAVNERVGKLLSCVLLFKHFDVYKKEHMMHHSPNKLLTHEDEFATFLVHLCGLRAGDSVRVLWRKIVVNSLSPAFHVRFLARRLSVSLLSHDRKHNLVGIGVLATLVGGAAALGVLPELLLAWLLPLTVLLQVATIFRILCEHRFPEEQIVIVRGKIFICHATVGVFPGAMPPDASARTMRGAMRWTLWWANMLTLQLFVRLFVLVGDAPCHDFHHRHPATRKWTRYIEARQADIAAGCPGFPLHYQETWGLFRAIDQNLRSLSETTDEVFRRIFPPEA